MVAAADENIVHLLHREPTISVVILAVDDSVGALDAVSRLRRPVTARGQVVVVEHGPWRGVSELVATLDVDHVRVPATESTSAAWVHGLRRAVGDIVIAVSSDVALRPGWQARVAASLSDRDAVAAAGDRLGTWVGPSTCLAVRGEALRRQGPFGVTDVDDRWFVETGVGPDRSRWRDGMREEVGYWAGRLAEVASGVGPYARDFTSRLDPALELSPRIGEALNPATLDGEHMTVLDVGSGPAPIVGRWWQGRPVEVTSLDPLASQYAVLVEAAGIDPTVPVRPGQVETLLDDIGDERFDVVWMCNALDHSEDAIGGVRNLVEATKPGGAVVLSHVENEGEHASYGGLHHWNITIDDGRPRLWWRGGELWLDDWLGEVAAIESASRRDQWIDVTLRRPRGSDGATSGGRRSVVDLTASQRRVSAL